MTLIKKTNFGADVILSASTQTPPRESNIFTKGSNWGKSLWPETAAHRAPPSLGFSRQEHWSGLPFPSPMHESEK